MTRSEIVRFLSQHQPMASVLEVAEEDLGTLAVVADVIAAEPDPELLELLLGVFGEGDGSGVYGRVVDAIVAAANRGLRNELVVSLRQRLAGPGRFWLAHVVVWCPDPILVASLTPMLHSPEFDDRWAAIVALEAIGTREAVLALEERSSVEDDEELQPLIEEVVRGLG